MTALRWGVKESFRGYVEGAGGTIEAGQGAERTDDGAFSFAATPGTGLSVGADGRPEGRGAFAGEVLFQAHGGMLSVFLADPAVEFGPEGGVLSAADSEARTRRVEVAKLDVGAAASEAGEISLPATLTRDGSFLLGDHYPPGAPIDPVRLVLAGG